MYIIMLRTLLGLIMMRANKTKFDIKMIVANIGNNVSFQMNHK
jgi:hypothetical protein